MRRSLVIFLASAGWVGKIPLVPATAASALLCTVILWVGDPTSVAVVAAVSATLGLLLARSAVDAFGRSDPREFVLDELAGMSLALLFLPITIPIVVTGFLVFRFLDVVKPLGIRALDGMDHPTGIVWDDLLAGAYTNLVLQVVFRAVRGSN